METREEYRQRAEAKIEELRPKVWIVKQRAEEMTGETRAEYDAVFEALHAKLKKTEESLQELDEVDDETWQDVKARLDGCLSDLNNSLGNVLSRLG